MAFAYCLNMPMSKTLAGALLTLLAAKPLAAQFPRLAPPPPCKASYSSPALLTYWPGANRDNRPKVAVFALQPDVDDAGRIVVTDHNSGNGIVIEDTDTPLPPGQPTVIDPGATLRLGDVTLTVAVAA